MFGLSRFRLLPSKSQRTTHLLSSVDMERVLAKERVRCDRYCLYFSLIVIRLNPDSASNLWRQESELGLYLSTRLRQCDEAGYMVRGGLGVLLPMTMRPGALVVLADLRRFANDRGFAFQAEVFDYVGHDGLDARDDADLPGGDEPLEPVLDTTSETLSSKETVIETIRSSQKAIGQKIRVDNPVRADEATQKRVVDSNKIEVTEFCSKPYPAWKRMTDIVLASVGLLLAWPVLMLAAICIKLTSKGPVFFVQQRTGQYGRPFAIYKLRTMIVDAEEIKHLLRERNERDGPAFKMAHDPRVTRVGKIMRKVGVDELPQLWNVLRGDMSIVGPRPLPVNEDNQCASWQQSRLDTKPGLTCTWQVSKSRKISFREWMRLDVRYRNQRGIVSDVKLVLQTVKAVLLGRVGH